MGDLNVLKIIFLLMTIVVVVFGSLVNVLENVLPVFIVKNIRYGKFAFQGKDKSVIKSVEVPKSWFKHFYVFASILSVIALFFVFGSYVLNVPIPFWLRSLCDKLGNRAVNRETAAKTLLATVLLTIQCVRRCYDTHFVSIFSSTGRMNLSHYIVGYLHYLGAVVALLVEGPNFTLLSNKVYYFRFEDLQFKDLIAAVVFLFACYKQFETTVILANLRKDPQGKVISNGHFMPKGGLFKYVSSPHLLSEITMYITLTVILWHNSTWKYVLFWVLCNQIETALLAHWWYKQTFEKYPAERKAIIPFIL